MAKSLIPLFPPSGEYELTNDEMVGLSWLVLSGASREDVFLRFMRPDFIGSKSKVAVKSAVTQFFAGKDVIAYMEAYKSYITDFLAQKPSQKKEDKPMSIDERKELAKNKLVEFAIEMTNNIDQAEDPEAVLKIADKIGLLDIQEQIEQPRRYLPTTCGGCAYRVFCEENAEDDCPYCKYKIYGEEHGVHFEKENMLTKEFGTDIAKEQTDK